MSLGALDLLAGTKPKENAGARTGNRFQYQWNWSLKKMLELEDQKRDYVMIFDYHDDLVVCDSDKDDANIDFYQIKTHTNGNWTKGELTKPGYKHTDDLDDDIDTTTSETKKYKGTGLCVLAKLMDHSSNFDSHARDFYFVTDAKLAFFKKHKEIVDFNDLNDKDKIDIKDAIHRDVPSVKD